jgi:hypothetical protein
MSGNPGNLYKCFSILAISANVAKECVLCVCSQAEPTSVRELVVGERICVMEVGNSFGSLAVVTIGNVLRVCALASGGSTACVNVNEYLFCRRAKEAQTKVSNDFQSR